jgi:hypothetical protein
MKKTSRRSFAKLVATAIAAVPIASSLEAARSQPMPRQKPTGKKPIAPVKGTEGAKNEHNTPPPIIIGDGSLIVERPGKYATGDIVVDQNNHRRLHKINPDSTNTKLFPAHIKVIDGSGEILFRNDDANDCLVTLSLVDKTNPLNTAIVNAGASPIVNNKQTFIIDTDEDKLLAKTRENTGSTKRDVRYRHKHGTNNKFLITGVKITQGPDVLYRVVPETLPSKGNELKVMIWLEQS